MARGEKKKNLPKAGWKRFGHRSHVGGNRMKLDKDSLSNWASKMESRYCKKPKNLDPK